MASAANNYLAPLSMNQIQQRAAGTVSAAYAPVYASLSQQQKQIQALNAKRQADNAYYNDWLTGQNAKLEAGSQAFDRGLVQNGQDIQNQITGAFSGLRQDLANSATNRVGNVSNPAQDTQTTNAVGSAQGRAQAMVGTDRQATLDTIQNNEHQRAATFANNIALAASNEARRTADTWTALSKITNDEQSTKLKEAADTAKEVQTLITQEINKENANRNYNAVLGKLGISQQNANTSQFKATTGAQHQRAQDQTARGNLAVAQQRANDTAQYHADTIALRRADQAYKQAHPNAAKDPSYSQRITTVTNDAFNRAYALMQNRPAVDSKGKPIAGTPGTATSNASYGAVKRNPEHYVSLLVSNFKVNKTVAEAVVHTYLNHSGQAVDPSTVTSSGYPQLQQFLSQRTG